MKKNFPSITLLQCKACREDSKFMNLEILTPERKLYSGDVYGVQLPGVTGLFEVLDKHAPIVSALKAGRLKILKDKNHHSFFDIQSGFVEVINNKATVLVEGAVPIEAAV